MVHLKRFDNFMRKVRTYVQYPMELDLHKLISNKSNTSELYSLYGVLVHDGFSVNSGHYYSYIKNNNKWYCMNDSFVSSNAESNVLKQKPYILFYQRKQQNVQLTKVNPINKIKLNENSIININNSNNNKSTINGDWGLGIGDWGLGPIPNPQSPIPKKIIY